MNRHVRLLLCRWLNFVSYGIILSTGFCIALLVFDVGGFATHAAEIDGSIYAIVTLWVLLILVLAPLTAMTDELLR